MEEAVNNIKLNMGKATWNGIFYYLWHTIKPVEEKKLLPKHCESSLKENNMESNRIKDIKELVLDNAGWEEIVNGARFKGARVLKLNEESLMTSTVDMEWKWENRGDLYLDKYGIVAMPRDFHPESLRQYRNALSNHNDKLCLSTHYTLDQKAENTRVWLEVMENTFVQIKMGTDILFIID